jgi:hypothetical protein
MPSISLFSLISIVLISLSLVLGAPSQFKPTGEMPSDHVQDLAYNSQPASNSSSEKHSEVSNRGERLSRRSSSNPRIIFMPNNSGNYKLAESLLDAANVLLSDTSIMCEFTDEGMIYQTGFC